MLYLTLASSLERKDSINIKTSCSHNENHRLVLQCLWRHRKFEYVPSIKQFVVALSKLSKDPTSVIGKNKH